MNRAPQSRAWQTAAANLTVVTTSRPEETAAATAGQCEGDFALSGVGESMQPCYRPGTAVVVHPTSYFMLRPGMPVVYVSRTGHQVAHILLEESADGWTAIGLNNSEPDDELVTARNLVGMIRCAYVPPIPDARKRDSLALAESGRMVLLH